MVIDADITILFFIMSVRAEAEIVFGYFGGGVTMLYAIRYRRSPGGGPLLESVNR